MLEPEVDLTTREALQSSTFLSDAQRSLYLSRWRYQPQPHGNPNSVLVAAIGNLWQKGSRMAVKRMVEHHASLGFQVFFEEIPDSNSNLPYSEIGHMRDIAMVKAVNLGVEWLFMLDCDILPEPDLMTNLMGYERPVIAPIILDPEGFSYSVPRIRAGKGLCKVKWFIHSAVLIHTSVLRAFQGLKLMTSDPSENAFHLRLWTIGHESLLHTGHECKVATLPSGFGDRTIAEWGDYMEAAWNRRMEPVDRVSERET